MEEVTGARRSLVRVDAAGRPRAQVSRCGIACQSPYTHKVEPCWHCVAPVWLTAGPMSAKLCQFDQTSALLLLLPHSCISTRNALSDDTAIRDRELALKVARLERRDTVRHGLQTRVERAGSAKWRARCFKGRLHETVLAC